MMKSMIRDCLWDYSISEPELQSIITGGDMKKKQWLFNRIVYNSQDKIGDLLLFSKKDLCTLFDGFTFSHRSGLTWEVYMALRNTMLNERQYIEKLQWKKI